MNSNYGKSNTSSGSLNSFNFDIGLNSGRPKSLNDQKSNTSTSSYVYTSTQPKPNTGSSWASQTNRPSWTHQPAAAAPAQSGRAGSLSGPTSMVGDIFGKSWSSGPATTGASIGIVKKDSNLFGDLVNSAMGQNKGGSGNVPLKNAGPTGNKSTFAMGGMADSLPKTSSSAKSGGSWGSTESFGSFTSAYNPNKNSTSNVNLGGNNTKGPNLGGPSIKSMAGTGSGIGIGMNSNKDPFGNLVDFSAKPSNSMNSGGKAGNKSVSGDDSFGEFQNSTKTSGSTFSSNAFPSVNNSSSMGSSTGAGYSKVDDFGVFNTPTQPSPQPSGVNDFDSIFASSTTSSGGAAKVSDGFKNQQFSGGDDWGIGEEFGGGEDTSGTTEIEGLPPPPAGVSASTAKNKGMDNYKNGQYADAIKWLSWAVVLLERAGDDDVADVLSSRASCYKEVGEYKKAVADCTKVLEQDGKNISVLVQRALLYESMEKYKLGAEDLRTVMKLDPINRVARSTIHRLTQMAG